MSTPSTLQSLLRRAMDSAAHLGEATNAADKFVKLARRDHISFDDFTGSLAILPPPAKSEPPPIFTTQIMSFGKYEGRRLCDIAADDLAYLKWVSANCTRINATLSEAINSTIEWAEGGDDE